MHKNQAARLNPWLSMWTRPQQTILQIIESDPRRHVIWLAALTGAISSVLPLIFQEAYPDIHWHLVRVLVSLILGAVAGIGWLFIWAALIQWMGRGFAGSASREQVRAVIAWSALPFIAVALLSILILSLRWWQTSVIDATFNTQMLADAMRAMHWAAAAYWAILFFSALAKVQNFSIWKAVLNTALAHFMLVAFIYLLGIIMAALVDLLVIAGWLPV